MLTRKTVLVLGAGASVPYGFPTGIQLSKTVTEYLAVNAGPRVQLRDILGFSDEDIGEFCDAFYHSGRDTVDGFLEHRPQYMNIGKAAIALVLIPKENADSLFRYDNDGWLRYLYNKLNTSFEDFGSNRLSIITFNYDRAVEYFLLHLLKIVIGKAMKTA